jgi:hypothetical protein
MDPYRLLKWLRYPYVPWDRELFMILRLGLSTAPQTARRGVFLLPPLPFFHILLRMPHVFYNKRHSPLLPFPDAHLLPLAHRFDSPPPSLVVSARPDAWIWRPLCLFMSLMFVFPSTSTSHCHSPECNFPRGIAFPSSMLSIPISVQSFNRWL